VPRPIGRWARGKGSSSRSSYPLDGRTQRSWDLPHARRKSPPQDRTWPFCPARCPSSPAARLPGDPGQQRGFSPKSSFSDNKTGIFQLDVAPDLDWADVFATFKALESDNLGEIISSPQVTVKSGGQGRVQVGTDVSVTLQDFAGNTVTQFISTGAIMTVRPFIVTRDSVDFIVLTLEAERSSSQTGESGLEILKTQAKTDIMLLDGEETIIAGLYSNEFDSDRAGVPFLKDLPWWFFGLRYVFGYEAKKITKKELLILLKADLLPTLMDRFSLRSQRKNELLKNYHRAMQRRLEYYKRQTNK